MVVIHDRASADFKTLTLQYFTDFDKLRAQIVALKKATDRPVAGIGSVHTRAFARPKGGRSRNQAVMSGVRVMVLGCLRHAPVDMS
jgi:hypothetical protein